MTFSHSWLRTKFSKPLSSLSLLDIAYIVTILPLFVMLKMPMIVFLFISIGILVFKKYPAKNILVFFVFVLGVIAVFLSLYGAFSFSGLSRLKIFLELLVYILLIVVSMQRLTHTINFYLIFSPFLFLALSLFFYHGILMLSYVVFEVFFLLWLILASKMQGRLIESFRASMVMFAYSLPWVVLLFIFFPRISFEHADYGFKGENIQRMGHDGTMFLDANALLVPSSRIVMEVGFESTIPPASDLYFRGSILYIDKKDHWEKLPTYLKRKTSFTLPSTASSIQYNITLYPTQKKWLYTLDMPSREIANTSLDADLISTEDKAIKEPIHYQASSSLSPVFQTPLDKVSYKASTHYNTSTNTKTYRKAQEIKEKYKNLSSRALAIEAFFKAQALTYTLKPDALDMNNSTDSFLFDKRKGYCVHFASSFVTMSRMVDIPARIVTGYKSDGADGIENYLAVREKDAHAWAELYIDGAWKRFESTATATYIDEKSQALLSQKNYPIIEKIHLYLLYAKYQIETWILYYSHVRQLELLAYAKANPSFVVGFVISILSLMLLSFMMLSYFRRPQYSSKALEALQPLLKVLEKKGYKRQGHESMHQFLRTLEGLEKVDKHYEEIRYAQKYSKAHIQSLKKAVKQSLKGLK